MMPSFGPLHLVTSAPLLRRLEREIVSISMGRDTRHAGTVWVVWLTLQDGGSVKIQASDTTFPTQFEVFTLRIAPVERIPSLLEHEAVETAPWPFWQWRMQVLQRLEWSFLLGEHPSEWPDVDERLLGPGETPTGTTSTCLVSVGLLFEDGKAGRLLIAVGDTPLSIVATQDPVEIDLYLRACFRVPAARYAAALEDTR